MHYKTYIQIDFTLLLIDQTIAIAVMAMVGRFFAAITINAGTQYNVEIVPTQLRGITLLLFDNVSLFYSFRLIIGQGVGLIHIVGHGATFFSPLILYLVIF